MAEIAKISYTHEAFINWLVANPDRPLRDAAAYFGYTQAWLSSILHSDVFQAKLSQRQDEVFGYIAEDIPSKLRAAADIGLEKLTEVLTETQDGKFILDATDKLLHRMGYAPQAKIAPLAAPAPTTIGQQNIFLVSSEQLAEARGKLSQRGKLPQEEVVIPALPMSALPMSAE